MRYLDLSPILATTVLATTVVTAAACGGEAPADDCAPYRSAQPPTDGDGVRILPLGCDIDAPVPSKYVIEAKAGLLYRVNVPSGPGAPGVVVERPNEQGAIYDGVEGHTTFLAWDSGPHLLNLQAGLEPSATSAKLSLVVVSNPNDDHGDAPAQATSLIVGAPEIAGEIGVEAERDYFRFEAVAGQRYNLRLVSEGPFVARLSLLDGDGRATLDSANHLDDRVVDLLWTAPAAGTHVIRVGLPGINLGKYRVSAAIHAGDDHGDSAEAATPLTVGQVIRGRIESSTDNDWFSIAVSAGQRVNYQLRMTSGIGVRVFGPRTLGSSGSRDGNTFSGFYAADAAGTVEMEVGPTDADQGVYEVVVSSIE